MDYAKLLAEENAAWLEKRAFLSKDDIAFIGNKRTLRGKLLGFMTSAYYKRTKLIERGDIIYAYVFKEWSNDVQGEDPQHPTWMVFSPSKKLNDDPTKLKEIADKLQTIVGEDVKTKRLKTLKNIVKEPLSDASYFELPPEYDCGELAYLSVVYVIADLMPCFHLGYNLIVANQSVSKEVLYLPPKYWTEDYSKMYLPTPEKETKKED